MSQEQPDASFDWGIEELAGLYQAGHLLSKEIKQKIGLLIAVPVFLQDPLVAEQARLAADERIAGRVEWEPLSAIDVPCELDLMRGPTSARLTVDDYDASTQQRADPAEWDGTRHRFYVKRGREKLYLGPEHCELPQFHQVNVWAIVQKILQMYEDPTILGRYAPWGFEGNRLTLVPHAGERRDAFYTRDRKAIQFYYFHRDGRRVDTCLSHDIIAHETGHAILDGLRPLYGEDSSLQTAAFHEFVADTTAILAAFLNNELRFQTAQETGGDLSRDQVISGVAEEFGFYSYGRPFLRSAQDCRDLSAVQASHSQYEWSQVLTGAMFEILKEMLAIRMLKVKKSGSKPTLKEAFAFVCNRFRRVAFQPLDYLPPVDVQFADYARAVLCADEIVEPRDEDGYREAMARVFHRRGIECAEELPAGRLHFYPYDIERLARSRTDAYHFLNNNRRQLCIPPDQDIAVVDLYQTDKMVYGAGRLPREIILQYAWREDLDLKGGYFSRLQGRRTALLCGGTLVFDSRGNLLSWQHKPGAGKQETGRRRRGYCAAEEEKGNLRKEQYLAHLRERLASGAIRLDETGGVDSPVTVSEGADGRLRFRVAPHLRHWAEG